MVVFGAKGILERGDEVQFVVEGYDIGFGRNQVLEAIGGKVAHNALHGRGAAPGAGLAERIQGRGQGICIRGGCSALLGGGLGVLRDGRQERVGALAEVGVSVEDVDEVFALRAGVAGNAGLLGVGECGEEGEGSHADDGGCGCCEVWSAQAHGVVRAGGGGGRERETPRGKEGMRKRWAAEKRSGRMREEESGGEGVSEAADRRQRAWWWW